MNTAGKVTFLPDDSPFLKHTGISGRAHAMVGRGEGHAPLNLMAPAGKENCFCYPQTWNFCFRKSGWVCASKPTGDCDGWLGFGTLSPPQPCPFIGEEILRGYTWPWALQEVRSGTGPSACSADSQTPLSFGFLAASCQTSLSLWT